jgi:phage-related baseplate assembly protein
VDATGASVLSSTNLNISLNSISGAAMTSLNSGKSYTITGTLAQVQAALSTLKINSTSGRIMAANSGSIYLRVRANLIADATTDAQCLDIGNDGRIALYQYTSDQIRRKNVPQKSGSTP